MKLAVISAWLLAMFLLIQVARIMCQVVTTATTIYNQYSYHPELQ